MLSRKISNSFPVLALTTELPPCVFPNPYPVADFSRLQCRICRTQEAMSEVHETVVQMFMCRIFFAILLRFFRFERKVLVVEDVIRHVEIFFDRQLVLSVAIEAEDVFQLTRQCIWWKTDII